MGRVIGDISPSVDGYVAGPGVSVERPFGDADHRLHVWLGLEGVDPTPTDHDGAVRMFATAGAVVLGRRMFDVGIGTWGDDGAFGYPCFATTNHAHDDVVRNPTTFAFVTDGVAATVDRAQAAAGDGDVIVVGGASVVQQCLELGLVDELRLHVMPVLLGAGTPPFSTSPRYELESLGVETTPQASHLTYAVRPAKQGAGR